MKAWGALLVAIALGVLAAVPQGAAAKPGYFVSGPGRHAKFKVRGSNGYRIEVLARAVHDDRRGEIYVTAHRGSASVQYTVRGSLAADDSIDVHLPHVGRIAVHFGSVHVTHRQIPDNCRGRPTVVEHGYFRGTISMHGERDFTAVDRTSAPGKVIHSFRKVCDNEESSGAGGGQPTIRSTTLFVGEEGGPEHVIFFANQGDFGPTAVPPSFWADAHRTREGMLVDASVVVEGRPSDLVVFERDQLEAEVTPPRPFDGTATFRLTSRTTSTWEGDLAVELPGLGKVPLAGSEFWSALCVNASCTETLPPNVQVILASGIAGG